MGWFNKNEEVPQIAPAPILPNLPEKNESEKKDLPGLPSFPNNSNSENLNQEMVKSAVGDLLPSGENEVNEDISKDLHVIERPQRESMIPFRSSETVPESQKRTHKTGAYRTVHDPSWYAEQPKPIKDTSKKTFQEIPKKTFESNAISDYKPAVKRVEPIFVRIDKFQLAQKNFGQIKEKIKEMESVLGKIKDIKLKEEVELKGWTEDIEKIKDQLSEIDSSVFDQI